MPQIKKIVYKKGKDEIETLFAIHFIKINLLIYLKGIIMQKYFRANVGGMDQTIRLIAGLAVLVAGIFMSMNTVMIVVGVVIMLTSVLEWCPPYAIFGFSTCSKR